MNFNENNSMKYDSTKTMDENFQEFLNKLGLEDLFEKVKEDEWRYKDGTYKNNTFYIHNCSLSIDCILSKVYQAAKRDGENEAQQLAVRRFGKLFDIPREIY